MALASHVPLCFSQFKRCRPDRVGVPTCCSLECFLDQQLAKAGEKLCRTIGKALLHKYILRLCHIF